MRSQRGNRGPWSHPWHGSSTSGHLDAGTRKLLDSFGYRRHIARCIVCWIRLHRIHGPEEARTLRTSFEYSRATEYRVHASDMELLWPTKRSCRLRSSHTLQTDFAKTGHGYSAGGLSGHDVRSLHRDLAEIGQADLPLLAWWSERGKRWRSRRHLVCVVFFTSCVVYVVLCVRPSPFLFLFYARPLHQARVSARRQKANLISILTTTETQKSILKKFNILVYSCMVC